MHAHAPSPDMRAVQGFTTVEALDDIKDSIAPGLAAHSAHMCKHGGWHSA